MKYRIKWLNDDVYVWVGRPYKSIIAAQMYLKSLSPIRKPKLLMTLNRS